MAWSAVSASNSNWATQAATSVGAAGNNTSAGTFGWVDQFGNLWNVVNPSGTAGNLEATPTNVDFATGNLNRPISEAVSGGSRITVQFTAQNAGTVKSRIGAMLRFAGANAYSFQGTSSGGTGISSNYSINMTAGNAVTEQAISGGTALASYSALVSGNTYQLDCWIFGNSPTWVSCTFTNVTTSTQLATCFGWDNQSALQGASGVPGFTTWQQSASGPLVIPAAQTYTGSPPSAAAINLACSTTGTVGTPITLTFQPSGDATSAITITPSDGGGGGTFSTSTVTLSSGSSSPGTCTYTPGTTGTKTITFTDSSTLTHVYNGATTATTSIPLVVSGAPTTSFTISPTSAHANTPGQVITLAGTGTTWSGSPFSITGGLGSSLQSQSVTNGTTATVTLDPGIYGQGSITIHDSSSDTATLTVTPAVNGSANVGWIGDSITAADVGNGTVGESVIAANLMLNNFGYTTAHTHNSGLDGASTQTWLPTGTFLPAAMTAFASAGMVSGDLVHIMLGTNDARASPSESRSALTPAQHFANMSLIVANVVSHGYKVIISKPPFTWPYANTGYNNAEIWPYNCNATYGSYWDLDVTLCDGVNVFAGDTAAFEYSQQNPTTFLQTATGTAPGIHPANDTENQILGAMWATAIVNRYGASGGAVTPATQVFIAAETTCLVSTALLLTFFLDAPAASSVTITPTLVSGGGTLGAMSGPITAGSVGPVTCSYTPSTAGAKVISFANSGSLTNTGSPFTTTASAGGSGTPWVHG